MQCLAWPRQPARCVALFVSLAAVLAPARPPSGLRLGSYNNWWHPTHSPRPARGHIFSFPLPPRTLPRTASRPTSPAISISISSAQSASPCSPWQLPVNSHPIGSRAQSRPVETRLPTAAGYRQHGAKQLRSVLSLLHGLAIGGVYLPGAYASVSGGSVLASAPSSLHRSVPTYICAASLHPHSPAGSSRLCLCHRHCFRCGAGTPASLPASA